MAKIPPTLQISPWELYSAPFLDVNKAINVFVACGRKSYYQTINYWKEFVNIKEDCTIDGFKVDTIAPSSINIVNQGDNFVIVYPNPAKDVVVIENVVGNAEHITINVYDTQGRLVLSETRPNATSYTLNITSLTAGVYYVKVGEMTKKLIVEQRNNFISLSRDVNFASLSFV